MTILVASTNPVKVRAAEAGFAAAFPGHSLQVTGVAEITSGVSDQPMTDAETLQGAANRAAAARSRNPDADFFVGLEGGVQPRDDAHLDAFAWIVILSRDGRSSQSRTATFLLPPSVSSLVRSGVELGHAMDQVCSESNSKQKSGAVGLLTNNAIDRTAYYAHAVTLALAPLLNESLYRAQ